MKKILVTESQVKKVVNELFNDTNIYPVRKYEDKEYGNTRELRYDFHTKDNITYKILLSIWKNSKNGRIDFHTVSKNANYTSAIELINAHDAIKVFNTLRHIIYLHKDDIEKLIISSIPERVKFYKKLLDHLHMSYKPEVINGQHFLFVTL